MKPSDISNRRPAPTDYRVYVRQKIEAGLADLRAGRVHTHEMIRREFGMGSDKSGKFLR